MREERRRTGNLTQARRTALQKAQIKMHRSAACEDKSKKLPRTFADPKVLARLPGSAVMDICYLPRREIMRKYTELFGGKYYVIDPFTDPAEQQIRVWGEWYRSERPRLLLCTNILNMYADNAEVVRKMEKMIRLAREGVGIAITIYEGDRSGICKETAVEKWQRNQPAGDYVRYIRQHVAVFQKGTILLIGL